MKWFRANYLQLILSAVITALVLLVLPVPFQKYIIKLKFNNSNQDLADQVAFADIEGDGIDEVLIIGGEDFFNKNIRHGVSIKKLSEYGIGKSIEQLNVPERFSSPSELFVGDYDQDGKDEIYLPGVIDNTIYLYAWEYPNLKAPFIQTRVDTFVRNNDKADLTIKLEYLEDVTGDGLQEVYFSIRNSYPVYPRRMYRWNVANNSLIASPNTAFAQGVTSTYERNDTLFFGGICGIAGNYKPWMNIPYSDYYGYSYLLDQDLNFILEPKPLNEYPEGVTNYIFKGYLYTHVSAEQDGSTPYILIQSLNGKLIDTIFLSKGFTGLGRLHDTPLVMQGNSLFTINANFSLAELMHLDFEPHIGNQNDYDLEGDGKAELVLWNLDQGQFSIISDDFKTVTTKRVDFFANSPAGICRMPNGERLLAFYTKEGFLKFYSYAKNPFYPYLIVYILAVYGVAFLIIYIIFRAYRRNLQKRTIQEKELISLQMLTIKNQVDPHFTLNALNSIDYMYRNDDADRASKYMVKFSRLIHQSLMNSEKFTCSLYDELDFIRAYCQLEEVRSDFPFDYAIEVDEDLDPFEINLPRNLVFTYVENAIKHGLRPKEGERKLRIEVRTVGQRIQISVSDNGIGFKKSQELKTKGTGKGLEIIEQIISLYKKLTGQLIQKNVSSNNNGTVVTITLKP